jgi:hypothetical protein
MIRGYSYDPRRLPSFAVCQDCSKERNTMQAPYTVTTRRGEIASLARIEDAPAAVRAAIERDWIGSSDWSRGIRHMGGTAVKDASGKVVARVSYNGRFWRPDCKTPFEEGR